MILPSEDNTKMNPSRVWQAIGVIWPQGKPFIYEARVSNKYSFVCVYLDGWIYWPQGFFLHLFFVLLLLLLLFLPSTCRRWLPSSPGLSISCRPIAGFMPQPSPRPANREIMKTGNVIEGFTNPLKQSYDYYASSKYLFTRGKCTH